MYIYKELKSLHFLLQSLQTHNYIKNNPILLVRDDRLT